MIFAHDQRQYQRWLVERRAASNFATTGASGGGLEGAELEQVLYAMAHTNPDIVTIRTAPRTN